MSIYTARLYENEHEIQSKSGNDLDELFVWMLTQAHGKVGHFKGDITDNRNHEIIKHFKKCHEE